MRAIPTRNGAGDHDDSTPPTPAELEAMERERPVYEAWLETFVAQRHFELSREELTAICWNFFLHIDRNGERVFPEHQADEQFKVALDDAVGFAVECAVTGLAP